MYANYGDWVLKWAKLYKFSIIIKGWIDAGDSPLERQLGRDFLQGVSIYWERRLIFIFLMGFASGLPFLLSGATLSIWLTEAGVLLTAIGLFALVGTPYTLKYLWAPFIDRVPIPVLLKNAGQTTSLDADNSGRINGVDYCPGIK